VLTNDSALGRTHRRPNSIAQNLFMCKSEASRTTIFQMLVAGGERASRRLLQRARMPSSCARIRKNCGLEIVSTKARTAYLRRHEEAVGVEGLAAVRVAIGRIQWAISEGLPPFPHPDEKSMSGPRSAAGTS